MPVCARSSTIDTLYLWAHKMIISGFRFDRHDRGCFFKRYGVRLVGSAVLAIAVLFIGLVSSLNAAWLPVAPDLEVSGTTLTWKAIGGVGSYVLATVRNPTTTRETTYQLVMGTSFAPRAVPGQTVNYGLAANLPNAPWASEVTINWPSSSGGSSGAMLVGLNETAWGEAGAEDASAFPIVRMEVGDGESATDFTSVGVKVDMLFSGPYNTGGVSALGDPSTWAQNALSTFQSECGGSATNCPSIEVLNE
ncbi:MAG: hypothetical protein ACLPZR_20490, partial [Solirubrobacteraceae bacterium]